MTEISVIFPAYNVQDFVSEALRSVLDQDVPDLELIAVDDGSTDATGTILDQWAETFAAAGKRMQVVRRSQGGAGAARNDALNRAQGRYIAFVDADDRLHSGALRRLTEFLDNKSEIDLVFPLCRYINHKSEPLGIFSMASASRYRALDLLIDNPIHTGTGVTVRRDRIEAIGRFDTHLPAYIDHDFWIRLTAERGASIAAIPDILVDYRKRPGQITSDWRKMRAGWEACVARARMSGYGLSPLDYRAALAKNALTWSTIAYQHGDMSSARQLAVEFWRTDPGFALRNANARLRTMACLASILPNRVHDLIRSRYNGAVSD